MEFCVARITDRNSPTDLRMGAMVKNQVAVAIDWDGDLMEIIRGVKASMEVERPVKGRPSSDWFRLEYDEKHQALTVWKLDQRYDKSYVLYRIQAI